MQKSNKNNSALFNVFVGGEVHMGARIAVGGNLFNLDSGKINVHENGELNVMKDLVNEGDIKINDPEKIKELIIEIVKTSGSLAELGSNFLKTFFSRT